MTLLKILHVYIRIINYYIRVCVFIICRFVILK